MQYNGNVPLAKHVTCKESVFQDQHQIMWSHLGSTLPAILSDSLTKQQRSCHNFILSLYQTTKF